MENLVAVYQQIKETIKSRIIDGTYKPSQKIPSESELIKEFSVSRLTIRQAVGILVQEGFLVSKRGKGSFVAISPAKINALSEKVSSSIDDLFYHSQKLKTMDVKIEKVISSSMIKQKLNLSTDENSIYEVTRVRFVDHIPLAVTKSYLKLKYGKFLDEKKLLKTHLLIAVLEKEAGVKLRHVFQSIEATFADQFVSEKLKIASGSPMLRVERLMMKAKHKPVMLAISWYRADTFKYTDRFRVVHRKGETKLIYEGFANNAL